MKTKNTFKPRRLDVREQGVIEKMTKLFSKETMHSKETISINSSISSSSCILTKNFIGDVNVSLCSNLKDLKCIEYVEGNLLLNDLPKLESLNNNLKVSGMLMISECPVLKLPDNLQVKYLSYCIDEKDLTIIGENIKVEYINIKIVIPDSDFFSFQRKLKEFKGFKSIKEFNDFVLASNYKTKRHKEIQLHR